MSTPPHTLKADFYLLIVTLLAAAGWIFSKEAVGGFSPLVFMALRFVGSGLIMGLICHRALQRLSRSQWLTAIKVGTLFGIAMTFWAIGLKLTNSVGIGAFLTSSGLVMVPVLSLLFGDRPGLYVFAALPLALTGLACLSLDSHFEFGEAEGYFLLSALILGLMFILNSRAAAHTPALPLSTIQLMMTGLITGVASLWLEDWNLQQPAAIWGWFLASMLLASCLRFTLQTYALGMAPPSHSAIIMTLEPVWTALLAMLWLNESMTLLQAGGCALIFAAMLTNRWPAIRQWLKNRATV